MDGIDETYYRLLDELWTVSHEENPWFDVDKVKDYAVYIWTKPGNEPYSDRNVFDVGADEIWYYVDRYVIPKDAWPYIHRIQAKLREIRDWCEMNP